jgi:predicted dehydrogenase/threonine dehydrogenase-like Zn-dependent dehydrogenase
MRQIIQYQKTGEIFVEQVPAPQLKAGGVLVQNMVSLISAGTERSSVSTAQASLIGKARSRPDLVRQVMDNFKREGLAATIEKVQNRLDNYKELGYSSAGIVLKSSCSEFKAGDRVACGGVGYASHAEIIFVPKNLTVLLPDGVNFTEASYTTVAAIAMQGVRQADVRVGERVAVVGLGLIGLITVQLLKASGCLVIGLDVSERNFDLARSLGCDVCELCDGNSVAKVADFSRSHGADAVVITAATTSTEPVELATLYARKRGKVIIVGAVPMDVPRSPFYEKELDLRISCSYGPGRYDSEYEEHGHDYPIGYVRWTENRNMESILDLVAQRKVDVMSLTTHRFPIERSLEAYELITGKLNGSGYLGVVITYPEQIESTESIKRKVERLPALSVPRVAPLLGFIGAGNHAQSYLLPALKKLGSTLQTVVTSKPVNASSVAKKFKFHAFATEVSEILSDKNIDLVFINTRHDTHGRYVLEAMKADKAVFVEKPLAILPEELDEIIDMYNFASKQGMPPFLMVGYNRRFSPAVQAIRQFMSSVTESLVVTYRVNAGYLPVNSWYQSSDQGGRIVGESCHFVDTMQYLTGSLPISVNAISPMDTAHRYNHDNVSIQLIFANGSVGNITYVANGASSMSKEYLEISGGGRSATMDNFKQVVLYDGRKKNTKSFSGDKGHASEMNALLDGIRQGKPPISFESLVATSRTTFASVKSSRDGAKVEVE